MTRRKELGDLFPPKIVNQTPIEEGTTIEIDDTPEVIVTPVSESTDDPYIPLSVFNETIKQLRESILNEVQTRLASLEQAPNTIIESIQPELLKTIEDRLTVLESVKPTTRNQPVAWTVERDADGNLLRLKPE